MGETDIVNWFQDCGSVREGSIRILQCLVGSHAYGLSTPDSDEDRLGVFVTPTENLLGIFLPAETVDRRDPDICFHEVGKFIRLALKANPTILELLFVDDYEVLTREGQFLIDHRDAFLSQRISASYGGYALSQVRRLQRRSDGEFSSDVKGRYSKHARHCFRLLQQGRELLETGHLTVKVSNPEELMAIGELSPDELSERFEDEFQKHKAIESILPEKPDYDAVNDLLLFIRRLHL